MAPQYWVLSAWDGISAEKALATIHSLKRSLTFKKIVVLLPAHLDENTRNEITSLVDNCLVSENKIADIEDLRADPVGNAVVALSEKCIYLENGLMATRNPDICFNDEFKLAEVNCNGKALLDLGFTTRDVSNFFDAFAKDTVCIGVGNGSEVQLKSEPIALVGMSYQFPGDLDFWQFLMDGGISAGGPPENRWPKDIYPDADNTIKANFLSRGMDLFDAGFFGMSRYEAELVDPQMRIMLETTWEALEDAGIPLSVLADKSSDVGVFTGMWIYQYNEALSIKKPDLEYVRRYLANGPAIVPGKIANVLGTTGPTVSIEAACAGVSTAIGLAVQSLRAKDISIGIVSTANIFSKPYGHNDFRGVVAPDGVSKTFNADADGFGRGEGVATLILKRLSDAVADGDRIHSVIIGYGQSQDGKTKSMGTPTVDGEALALKKAFENAGVHPSQVSYVEAHGTGTKIGDPTEIEALSKIYTTDKRDEPLIIASVKANIGHSEGTSGAAGLIKVTLAMKHSEIPSHVGCTPSSLNPKIRLDQIPAMIPYSGTKWGKSANPRIAGVSSFGISGTNTHLLVMEPPTNCGKNNHDNSPILGKHFLPFSAKSEKALHQLIQSYDEYLRNTDDGIVDISYTAGVRRSHLKPYRAICSGQSKTTLIENLATLEAYSVPEKPLVCFLFSGQGNHYEGMGKEMYEKIPVFKEAMDFCFSILEEEGCPLKEYVWGNDEAKFLEYAPIATVVIEYAHTKVWESWGLTPDFVLGHSLGETAAALAAGVLDIKDTLQFMLLRTHACKQIHGKMIAVKVDLKTLEGIIKEAEESSKEWLDICCYNSPTQHVIGGPQVAVNRVAEICKNNGLKCVVINETQSLHTRSFQKIADELRVAGRKHLRVREPKCSFVSATTGNALHPSELNTDYFIDNLGVPVRFVDAAKTVYESGVRLFLETSPHPILSSLISENISSLEKPGEIKFVPAMRRGQSDLETTSQAVETLYTQGVDLNWDNITGKGNVVSVPTYPFQRESYHFEPSETFDSTHSFIGSSSTITFPLLGAPIPSPPSSTKAFVSRINLKPDRFQYISDHRIGDLTIFPAAGFVEICMNAGYFALSSSPEKPDVGLSIKDFSIFAPLQVDIDKAGKEVFTVVEDIQGDDHNKLIKISRKCETGEKWITHIQATFSFNPATTSGKNVDPLKFIQDNKEDKDFPNFYEKLFKLGYNFGPNFQQLKKLWRNEKSALIEVFLSPSEDSYICHPILIDALIQSLIVKRGGVNQLSVPIALKHFTCFPVERQEGKRIFVYVDEKERCELMTEDGKVFAVADGITLAETQVGFIAAAIQSQESPLPPLYTNTWVVKEGDDVTSSGFSHVPNEDILSKSVDALLEPEYEEMLERTDKIASSLLQRVLNKEEGRIVQKGEKFNLPNLCSKLEIREGLAKRMKHFLLWLQEDGLITFLDEDNFQVVKNFDECDVKCKGIEDNFLKNCMKRFLPVMQRKETVLPILFPSDEKRNVSSTTIYRSSLFFKPYNILFTKGVEDLLIQAKTKAPSAPLRILEVGAGTGSTTTLVLSMLQKLEITSFQYVFTDISPVYFAKAKEEFKNIEYKTLNLEEDPLIQGFLPFTFDIVIAANVLHATSDIRKAVRACRTLTKRGGVILVSEGLNCKRFLDGTWGLLDGYWVMKDENLRPNHALMDKAKWTDVLTSVGYNETKIATARGSHASLVMGIVSGDEIPANIEMLPAERTWLLLGSPETGLCEEIEKLLSSVGRRVVTGEVGNVESLSEFEGILFLQGLRELETQEVMIKEFLSLVQRLGREHPPFPKVVIATTNSVYIGEEPNPILSTGSTLWGMARTFFSEYPQIEAKLIDFDTSKISNLVQELFSPYQERQKVIRKGRKYSPRMTEIKTAKSLLSLPSSEKFCLQLPSTNVVADLKFVPLPSSEIPPGHVEVKVVASALNFKDFLNVIKPDDSFQKDAIVGWEFGGVVSGISEKEGPQKFVAGDNVFGFRIRGESLPSHVIVRESDVAKLPPTFTHAEGCTLPVAFSTAYHSLVDKACLKPGEKILIHTASGGVGLTAIQIAQKVGAVIFATAGTHKKRAYLKNVLGIRYVYNSRDLRFGEQILAETNNSGVDAILNSLTSEGFKETSLSCLAKKGRFIEMSRLNVWTPEEVKTIRSDVFYHILDFRGYSDSEISKLVQITEDWVGNGDLLPLPYTRFDVSDIRGAMEFLQKTKQIGKVVVAFPVKEGNEYKHDMCTERSTYLVTGGLGGIGLEVGKWIAQNGGKHIILMGRSAPSDSALQHIQEISTNGATVYIFQGDVSKENDVKKVFDFVEEAGLPPVKGIMHAAGTLSDATIQNQSWEKFQTTFNPKVVGGWALHSEAIKRKCRLEHFVMFSSMAATIGNAGQANHAAANAFLDALAGYRIALGLPASTVNWGQWVGVGIVGEKDLGGRIGIKGFTGLQGISALDFALRNNIDQMAVFGGDPHLLTTQFSWMETYLENLSKKKEKSSDNISTRTLNSEDFWRDFDSSNSKKEVVKECVSNIVRRLMKLGKSEGLDDDTNLPAIGLDSLMTVELKNTIQSFLGGRIPISSTDLDNCNTIGMITDKIVEIIGNN